MSRTRKARVPETEADGLQPNNLLAFRSVAEDQLQVLSYRSSTEREACGSVFFLAQDVCGG